MIRCPSPGCGVYTLDRPADRWCDKHGAFGGRDV